MNADFINKLVAFISASSALAAVAGCSSLDAFNAFWS